MNCEPKSFRKNSRPRESRRIGLVIVASVSISRGFPARTRRDSHVPLINFIANLFHFRSILCIVVRVPSPLAYICRHLKVVVTLEHVLPIMS